MLRRNPFIAGSLALFILSGCASTPPVAPGPDVPPVLPAPAPQPIVTAPPPPSLTELSGSVSYRERIALTPEAVVHVEVVREGPGEGQTRVVGEQTIREPGQVPIPFSVTLSETLDPNATYLVRARITDGELHFVSREPVPVLTQGNPARDVSVRVGSAAGQRQAP
ncbi:MAG: YbaY family lipoprotein [Cystobacter sp.]